MLKLDSQLRSVIRKGGFDDFDTKINDSDNLVKHGMMMVVDGSRQHGPV